MYISSLVIRNFRNFRASKLKFQKGINTIIGENGAGKTNLFYALRLLIDDTLPRFVRFYHSDFTRSLEQWEGHWIIISIELEELDHAEEIQALAVHAGGHMNRNTTGSYYLYFRPNFNIRKRLFDYSIQQGKSVDGLNLILNDIRLEDYETVFRCRGTADFSNNEVYKTLVGDFENINFPNPETEDMNIIGIWLPKEINILNEISCTFIKALRDVENDLKSYTNNPLINLLRGKEKTVEVAKADDIIKNIEDLNTKINTLKEIEEVKIGIDKSLKESVGSTYAPNIDIKSELPNEMAKLFQSLKLWVGDPDDEGYKGRIWELSLGGANLIYLSLKLLEYEKVKIDKAANFLLIEEPEAHIHTHIQKTLFNNLNKNRTQVIISTHSTHISSVSKISSVNILSRSDREAIVFNPSNNLESPEITRIERYLDAVRSTLLFAKGIILVEGDAEQILIPELFMKVFGISLDEIGISLINIGSTGFKNIARIFHEDRIKKNCAILTDLDKSILPLNEDSLADTVEEKHFRASEIKGAQRKVILDDFVLDNKYIKAFYAVNTFEVDFLLNDNRTEIKNCVDEIYSLAKKRSEVKEELENESVDVSGIAILRMANKKGKGWFSLIVAENIFYNTNIPDYIIEAIAFASSHINKTTLVNIALYRLNQIINDNSNEKELTISAKMLLEYHRAIIGQDNGVKDFLSEYQKTLKADQLTKLLKLYDS